ncbi:glycosyltransferase [Thermomonospora umbrina]|uniref:Glycosyltransferase involved in cell wall biosynthesis n=1 Tax=Thermomonospora umbrina TaxID=111806 RepID=A0A3D9SP26_9ACTN|nr:glycosyltransferase [Thermomonospora umbrina]REE97712.1 glycosyltransferase involved in cell wall biosynthesis [Thermomonospora umbrina]
MNGLPRVLHVTQPTTAGVAAYVADVCVDQRARGWHVAVACPDVGDLPERLAGLGIAQFPWEAGRRPGLRTLDEARRLRRLVQTFRPDIVHLHSSKAGLAGRLWPGLTRKGHRPLVVFQPHGWSWQAVGRPSLWWERLAARRTDLLVCVGSGEAWQGLAARIRGPYRVVRNGVDLTRFRPADAEEKARARTRLGVGQDVPLAVCVGRVTRQKGQDVLLAAWPRIKAECPRAELAIVGDGDRLAKARRKGGPGVRFTYAVDDPRNWYAAADVVVLPSRWEGLSLTSLEAMAMGRPVVASDIPGLAEVVGPGAGALVPSEDVRALSEAVRERLTDPVLAADEGTMAGRLALGCDAADGFAQLAALVAEAAGLPAAVPEEEVPAVAGEPSIRR